MTKPTCYKNPLNPSCTDLFLTNNANSFQKTYVSETDLSGFHKLIGRMMKSNILKQKPSIIKFRKFCTSYPDVTRTRSKLMNLKNYLLLHQIVMLHLNLGFSEQVMQILFQKN